MRKVRSLDGAVIYCKELNANVLVITSKAENEFIRILVSGPAWLGMKFNTIGSAFGSWKLLSGEEPSYSLVSNGEGMRLYSMSHDTRYNRYGPICAIFYSDERLWLPNRCSGVTASAVCKRPISDH